MQLSNSSLTKTSQYDEDRDKNRFDQSSLDELDQLTCCLKDAIFSKYISNYFIEQVEKMWILYRSRTDQFLKENRLNLNCDNHIRPYALVQLEEIVRRQNENILTYKRDIDQLCSSRKRARNNENYPTQFKSIENLTRQNSLIGVPKTPTCIERHEKHDHMIETNSSKPNIINNAELPTFSSNRVHQTSRHCVFQRGKVLPIDENTKFRRIRIEYSCHS